MNNDLEIQTGKIQDDYPSEERSTLADKENKIQ
jgi:hypothetical protein